MIEPDPEVLAEVVRSEERFDRDESVADELESVNRIADELVDDRENAKAD